MALILLAVVALLTFTARHKPESIFPFGMDTRVGGIVSIAMLAFAALGFINYAFQTIIVLLRRGPKGLSIEE
jgi:hypothetical protein